jgi:cytochrome c-type biogenesis protein CcmH
LLFWVIAAIVTVASLAVVFAPLLRGGAGGGRRSSYDIQIYRDQLGEIDRDVARGVLSAEEAQGTRIEVSRRLLAAADAEAREADAGAAPRTAALAGGAIAVGAAALAAWLYVGIGAPGVPDQPLAERAARQAEAWASRPRQAEAEAAVAAEAAAEAPARPEDGALVAQLQTVLQGRPDDVEGHRLLARSLASLGRYGEARAAQERVMALLAEEAGAEDHVALAELMIAAARGYVSPEAEAALRRALSLDPTHPPGRYYAGLALLQGGQAGLAYRLWAGLLEEGPPDAPWVAAIEPEIDAVAAMAGLPPPGSGVPSAPPAPAPEAMPPGMAAMPPPGAEMAAPDAETAARIEGMVASLGARLAEEGGSAEEWARLIRSLGVLGRIGEAAAIWREAEAAFAGEPAALALVREAARDARLIQ